jgi:hypothetical protein
VKGHYEVKIFTFPTYELQNGVDLPADWKPFATLSADYTHVHVVARKWCRDEEAQ